MKVNAQIPVHTYKRGKHWFAFCVGIKTLGYGKTRTEALSDFVVAAEVYFAVHHIKWDKKKRYTK